MTQQLDAHWHIDDDGYAMSPKQLYLKKPEVLSTLALLRGGEYKVAISEATIP
jgi:hypothetical protein